MADDSDRSSIAGTDEAGHAISTLVNRASVGVVEISPVGTFVTVDDTFADLTGYVPDDIRGEPVTTVFPGPDVASIVATLLDHDQSHDAPSVTTVVPLETRDGDVVPCELQMEPLGSGVGEHGFVGLVRRVSSKPDIQQDQPESAWARSFLALAEAVPDGIIVLDTNSSILYANPAVESILGHSPDDLVGGSQLQIIPPRLREVHLAALDRYLETGERHINWSYVELPGQHADGHEVPLGVSLNDFTIDGERYFVGLFRDIAPRKQAEEEAVVRVAQQEAIADLGRRALVATSLDPLFDDTVDLVAEMLNGSFASIFELDRETAELRLRAVHGVPDEYVESFSIPATAEHNPAGYALATEEPVVVTDLETETRFEVPEGMQERGIRSGISVTIGSHDDPWGVLNVHDREPREFTERDIHGVESVTNVLAAAIDRHKHTRQLDTQRAQLEAIAQVYRVVEDIQQAVVHQFDREEIEQTVCERLVDLDSYEFAWIGNVELPDRTLSPRAQAGDADDYLDELAVDLSDADRGQQLGGQAIETRETQIVADIATDERFSQWREAALQRGFRSLAVVPIVHQQRVYGILGVYGSEPGMFGEEVREVLDTLGELLGHAFTTLTQRQALHADTATEISLQLDGGFDLIGGNPFGGHRFEFDRTIPLGDGQYLSYASTTMSDDALAELEDLETVTSLSVITESETERRLAVQWNQAPITPILMGFGGRLNRGVIEDGTILVTVELPPSVDVAEVVEQIETTYPELDVALQQRVTREQSGFHEGGVTASLSERQRTALEAAYFGGYFEWPRESTGEELAESLDIAGATFSQHLRAAERRIFGHLLDDETAD